MFFFFFYEEKNESFSHFSFMVPEPFGSRFLTPVTMWNLHLHGCPPCNPAGVITHLLGFLY